MTVVDVACRVTRWAGRITGALMIGFVVFMIIGHRGLPNVLTQPLPVQLEFLGMFLCLAGYVLGWRRELWGGGIALSGFVLFAGTEIVVNQRFPGGAIPLFAVPAVLLLLSATIGRLTGGRPMVDRNGALVADVERT